MKIWTAAAMAPLLVLMTCASTGPKPAPQNPSPMVETTRAHDRLQQHPLAGKQPRRAEDASTTEMKQLGMTRTPVVKFGPHGMQQLSESRRGSFAVLGIRRQQRTRSHRSASRTSDIPADAVADVNRITSRDAAKAFAGEDIEKAHFLPRDREFLINPDETVRHYEVSAEEWAAAKK